MLNYVYSCLRNLLVVKQGQESFAYELLSLGMVLNKTEKLIRFFSLYHVNNNFYNVFFRFETEKKFQNMVQNGINFKESKHPK